MNSSAVWDWGISSKSVSRGRELLTARGNVSVLAYKSLKSILKL